MIAKAKRKRKRKPSRRWTLADWMEYRPGQNFGRLTRYPEQGPWYYREWNDKGRSWCGHTFDAHGTKEGHRAPITHEEYVDWLVEHCGYRRGPFRWHTEPEPAAPKVNGDAAYLARYQNTCRLLREGGLTPKPFDEWLAHLKAHQAQRS